MFKQRQNKQKWKTPHKQKQQQMLKKSILYTKNYWANLHNKRKFENDTKF